MVNERAWVRNQPGKNKNVKSASPSQQGLDLHPFSLHLSLIPLSYKGSHILTVLSWKNDKNRPSTAERVNFVHVNVHVNFHVNV
jgi:hypothetical protein